MKTNNIITKSNQVMKRNFTKLMLTFALLLVGVGSANATKVYADLSKATATGDQGAWNNETNTLSWTAGWSNLVRLPDLIFDWSSYTAIVLETSDYVDGPFRLRVEYSDGTNSEVVMYSAGIKNLDFAERSEFAGKDLSKVSDVRIGGASGAGSIVVSKVYLVKPTEFTHEANGDIIIRPSDLTVTGSTFDESTGEIVSNGSGSMAIDLPAEGLDLSALKGFQISYTGDNIFSNFSIGSKGFWSSVTGREDLANYIAEAGDPTQIKEWKWNISGDSNEKTMTISKITLHFSTIDASDPHYTPLTTSMFRKWENGVDAGSGYCEYHIGEAMGQGSTIFGNGSVVAEQYVDLSEYDELHITGTPGQNVRLLFNWGSTKNEVIQALDSEGFTSIDLSALPAQQLNAFKFQWDGKTATITSIAAYKRVIDSKFNYIFSGSGILTANALSALADENTVAIDATGITKAIALNTANPNCLIAANEGMVTNESNVIVGGTCANLVLTDNHPFKAPIDFTATAVTYSTTINASAKAGTLVLPFSANLPEGVKAYTLGEVADSKVEATLVDAITANQPVLLNGEGEQTFTGADVAVATTADEAVANGSLNGVYQSTDITEGYVLQNHNGNVGFYHVASTSTVKPFRAYLTSGNADARISIVYADETTGINMIEDGRMDIGNGIYDLQGRRMESSTFNTQSSNLKKGIYVKDGKKHIVK